jgi:glycosyltransferase
MKISIITVVYNNITTIKDTIESVLSQDYADIEYIIVDGGSTDGTLEVIKSYGNRITKFISEPDKGIYDAMNKGLRLATGKIAGILNSDDFYADSTVISSVIATFQQQKTDSVYGDLVYVKPQNTQQVLRYWRSGKYNRKKFLFGWMPPHPAFFVKRELYEKLGYFNLDFTSAADYELMLRFLYKHRISAAYLPKLLVKMRAGGKSNKSVENRVKANREDKDAWIVNNLKFLPFTFILKPIRKIPQFFIKK